jgi:hypothetical protein
MAQNNVNTAFRNNGVTQTVAYTGTAGTISNAISASVNMVDVTCTTAAYVTTGIAPTATAATGRYVAANLPTLFKVTAGEKVSAVQVAAGGNLYVSELTH